MEDEILCEDRFGKYGINVERYRNDDRVSEAPISYQQFVKLSRPVCLLDGDRTVVRRGGYEYDDYYTSWAIWAEEPNKAGGNMLMRKYVLGDGDQRESVDPEDGPQELSWEAYEKLGPNICNDVALIGLNPAEPNVDGVQPRPWSFFHCDNYEDPCFIEEGETPTGKAVGRNTDWKLRRYFAKDRGENLSDYRGAFMTDVIHYALDSQTGELRVAEKTDSRRLKPCRSSDGNEWAAGLDMNFEVLYRQLELLNPCGEILLLPAGVQAHCFLVGKGQTFSEWLRRNDYNSAKFKIPELPLYHWSCRRNTEKRISEVLECIDKERFVELE